MDAQRAGRSAAPAGEFAETLVKGGREDRFGAVDGGKAHCRRPADTRTRWQDKLQGWYSMAGGGGAPPPTPRGGGGGPPPAGPAVDCAKSNNPNKVVWIVVIILLPFLGSILYFLIGRRNTWA